MDKLAPTIKTAPIRRRRKIRINMTSLVYHTVREQFGGRQGVTSSELCQYFDDNNIEYLKTTVRSILLRLSGGIPRDGDRDELTKKFLKKDIIFINADTGKRGKLRNIARYYLNPQGTVRVLPIEGNGVWYNTGINGLTVAKLSRMTNTEVSLERF